MRLLKYEVLGADDINVLEQIVNEAIDDGMVPIGGVSVCVRDDTPDYIYYAYLQAMGLYHNEDIE